MRSALRRLPRSRSEFGGAERRGCCPVSDEKIGLEYKIKRMLQGSLLDPIEAHVFWNGTFSRGAEAHDLRHGWDVPASIDVRAPGARRRQA